MANIRVNLISSTYHFGSLHSSFSFAARLVLLLFIFGQQLCRPVTIQPHPLPKWCEVPSQIKQSNPGVRTSNHSFAYLVNHIYVIIGLAVLFIFLERWFRNFLIKSDTLCVRKLPKNCSFTRWTREEFDVGVRRGCKPIKMLGGCTAGLFFFFFETLCIMPVCMCSTHCVLHSACMVQTISIRYRLSTNCGSVPVNDGMDDLPHR